MTGSFWTPYRRGAAVALIGFGASLFFCGGLLLLLTRQANFAFWLLVPALVAVIVTSAWTDQERPTRGGFVACRDCGKPVFEVSGRQSFGFFWTRFWPERDCSECGADLNARTPS